MSQANGPRCGACGAFEVASREIDPMTTQKQARTAALEQVARNAEERRKEVEEWVEAQLKEVERNAEAQTKSLRGQLAAQPVTIKLWVTSELEKAETEYREEVRRVEGEHARARKREIDADDPALLLLGDPQEERTQALRRAKENLARRRNEIQEAGRKREAALKDDEKKKLDRIAAEAEAARQTVAAKAKQKRASIKSLLAERRAAIEAQTPPSSTRVLVLYCEQCGHVLGTTVAPESIDLVAGRTEKALLGVQQDLAARLEALRQDLAVRLEALSQDLVARVGLLGDAVIDLRNAVAAVIRDLAQAANQPQTTWSVSLPLDFGG